MKAGFAWFLNYVYLDSPIPPSPYDLGTPAFSGAIAQLARHLQAPDPGGVEIAVHCIALHRIALHCIAMQCIASYCIALQCIALHCIALHCD